MAPVWTGERPATSDVQNIADAVKSSVEHQIGHKLTTYIAKTCRDQDQTCMLGKLYLIKIDISNNNVLHIEVFVPRQHSISDSVLLAVVENFRMSDPLEPLV
ncbi:cystatin-B-like isoform X1 [Hypanus sabinus]|uniref:cystatin-B-like isoform X1 n=1 Tax=Hypanus sabinus TaxID=79690 RepID=UPI0028C4B535|nr:cystatin-B-like isoform X1 [Hypanus sabinus]